MVYISGDQAPFDGSTFPNTRSPVISGLGIPAGNTSSGEVPDLSSCRLPASLLSPGNKLSAIPLGTYTHEEILAIRNALKLASKLLDEQTLYLGPGHHLCAREHAFTVGLSLITAGQSAKLIQAGILSTAFDVTPKKRTDELIAIVRSKANEGKLHREVADLIIASRIPLEGENIEQWLVKYLQASFFSDNTDVATLVCARKTDLILSLLERAKELSYETPLKPSSTGSEEIKSLSIIDTLLRATQNPTTDGECFMKQSISAYLIVSDVSFRKASVEPILIEQFRASCIELCHAFNYPVPSDFSATLGVSNHSDQAMRLPERLHFAKLVGYAANLCIEHFADADRQWGPNEKIPLSLHAIEVGFLLALVGEKTPIVVAGTLHDAYENYVPDERRHLLRALIRTDFGQAVNDLIEAVTEPDKSSEPGNWSFRKQAVLTSLRAMDVDVATVVCASKISTLAAGNKMRWMEARSQKTNHPTLEKWSKGSWEENCKLFEQYLEIFEEKGVNPQLLAQFKEELRRFTNPVPCKPAQEASEDESRDRGQRAG